MAIYDYSDFERELEEMEPETEEQYIERMLAYEADNPTCSCDLCHCMQRVSIGGVCNDCLNGCHQG